MDSSQQHLVSDHEARRLAKGFVKLITSPFKLMGTHGVEKPVTIADAIRLGAIFIGAFNVATGNPELKEKTQIFTEKIAEYIYLPDAMEEFLFIRFKEQLETKEEILKSISYMEAQMSGLGAVRKFLKTVLAETMPKARQGRPTLFNPDSDPDRFLDLSAKLSNICSQFLNLQKQFPRKSVKELIDFLLPEDPKGAEFLRKRVGYVSEIFNDFDFRILKTPKARVRRLADALAGKQLFNWSFTYAVQRAGEFRRSKGIDPEE
jgi:hypothetical protein